MTPTHRTHRAAATLLLGALAACGDDGEPNEPGQPVTRTVTLNAVDGNGITGTATIIRDNASTSTVTVSLAGMPPNTEHAGHVHRGSCVNQGPIDQGLTPITAGADGSGSATTTGVSNSLLGPGYYFQYHVQLSPPGAPISCGDISAQATPDDPPTGGPDY